MYKRQAISPYYRKVTLPNGSPAVELYPAQPSGRVIRFAYLSKGWLQRTLDSEDRLSDIEDDNNIPLLDDELIEMNLLWRFRSNRGLEYEVELAEFEQEMDRQLAMDAQKVDIPIGCPTGPGPYDRPAYVPDGSWNIRVNG